MVTVKLFGTFRLDSRLKVLQLDVSSVKEIYPLIISEIKKIDPSTELTEKDLKGCIVAVNGKQARLNAKLRDGDEVCLMPAVAGG
ncbi:MAG: MoaD/ThiS family protein [Clostridia bacterium]|nr:MoaD/ThiS family protein [Clostridia bacterium]